MVVLLSRDWYMSDRRCRISPWIIKRLQSTRVRIRRLPFLPDFVTKCTRLKCCGLENDNERGLNKFLCKFPMSVDLLHWQAISPCFCIFLGKGLTPSWGNEAEMIKVPAVISYPSRGSRSEYGKSMIRNWQEADLMTSSEPPIKLCLNFSRVKEYIRFTDKLI